jgi:hypothetical protein
MLLPGDMWGFGAQGQPCAQLLLRPSKAPIMWRFPNVQHERRKLDAPLVLPLYSSVTASRMKESGRCRYSSRNGLLQL